jgi:hypothetical protein
MARPTEVFQAKVSSTESALRCATLFGIVGRFFTNWSFE